MSNGALNLSGRLGVEAVRDLKGCCVDSILAWRPQLIGQKAHCLYCDNPMKSVRPGDFSHNDFGFFPNKEREVPAQEFSELWFSCKRFENPEKVQEWCEDRDITVKSIEQPDDMAYLVRLANVEPGTAKALWAAQGVIATIGVAKAISAGSMISGGMVNPTQGSPASQSVAPFKPVTGTTEEADGHAHDFRVEPDIRSNGKLMKGRTNVVGEHFHEIELAMDGETIDGRTMPSQDIVGGHAHRHRVVHPQVEAAVVEVAAKSEPYGELLGKFNTRLDNLVRR